MTVEYVAVPDPDRPDQMTHWRRKGGVLRAYPRGTKYGPEYPSGRGRRTRAETRMVSAYWDWYERVRQAVDADPVGARRRFARSLSRCSLCGRRIWDEVSVDAGMGPECRGG